MRSSNENEIVISFFAILSMMLKTPQAKRVIDWNMRFFDKDVSNIDPGSPIYNAALRMSEELTLCQHRRRSRFHMYNASNIDEVYNHYWIHKSPTTLGEAWNLFETGKYRTEV